MYMGWVGNALPSLLPPPSFSASHAALALDVKFPPHLQLEFRGLLRALARFVLWLRLLTSVPGSGQAIYAAIYPA